MRPLFRGQYREVLVGCVWWNNFFVMNGIALKLEKLVLLLHLPLQLLHSLDMLFTLLVCLVLLLAFEDLSTYNTFKVFLILRLGFRWGLCSRFLAFHPLWHRLFVKLRLIGCP